VAALGLLSAACSYRTLNFFFDGVPPPGSGGAATVSPAEARRAVAVAPAPGSQHGPYAAKMCDGCHVTTRGNALVVPAEELCARCHTLGLTKRFVHGPLTAGGCRLCHDPHSSANAALLISDSASFCVRCHDRRSLRPVPGHDGPDTSCTACHEAHMSDQRYLLK